MDKTMGEHLQECLDAAVPAVDEIDDAECRAMLAHVVAGAMMSSGLPASKLLEMFRAQLMTPQEQEQEQEQEQVIGKVTP